MIKSFKNIVNEDYFSKLASRKDNGDVRLENKVEWIDLGLKSGNLWCSVNVSDDNEYGSLFTDAESALSFEQPENKIFLPTEEDFKELISSTDWQLKEQENEWLFISKINGNSVIFQMNGSFDSHTGAHRGNKKGIYWSKSHEIDDYIQKETSSIMALRIDMSFRKSVTISSYEPSSKLNIRLVKKL